MQTYPAPLVERPPLCGDDVNGSMLRQPPNGGRSPVLPPLTGLWMLPNLVRLEELSMWDQLVVPPPLRLAVGDSGMAVDAHSGAAGAVLQGGVTVGGMALTSAPAVRRLPLLPPPIWLSILPTAQPIWLEGTPLRNQMMAPSSP